MRKIRQALTSEDSEEQLFANNNHETNDGVSAYISSFDDEANFCLGTVYWLGRTIRCSDNLFPLL